MKISFLRYLFAILLLGAGINHFLNPELYYPLIPPWLPNPWLLNLLSGLLEVLFAVGLMTKSLRKISALGIIGLMILFIPAHIHHIQMDGCVSDEICIPVWAAWIRLVILQPLLIVWAWAIRK
ncbi:MAG: DoxX family membrane protein [Balneolaceae bacterium]